MTVRQIFYRAVSDGLVEKTEPSYKRMGELLTEMRRDGDLPFSWIIDPTRWVRRATAFESLPAALEALEGVYRRNVWPSQPVCLMIVLEKEALAGVLSPVDRDALRQLRATEGGEREKLAAMIEGGLRRAQRSSAATASTSAGAIRAPGAVRSVARALGGGRASALASL